MTSPATTVPEILPLGLNALIVRFGLKAGPALTNAVQAFVADLKAEQITGVTQVAGSLTTVMVEFDASMARRADIVRKLEVRVQAKDWLAVARPDPLRRWTIPVSFGGDDGPNLPELAATAGLSVEDAIKDLCAQEVEVLTIGFTPGQAYLGFLGDRWNIPRRDTVNPSVPAGALILAIRQVIIFTNENPTGWHHIGQTGFLPFALDRSEPILLRAGDVLAFEPVAASEMQSILADNPDGTGRAKLEVLR